MSTYKPTLSSIPLDPSIPRFFEQFYATSDNPAAHEPYADAFTSDATLIMGLRQVAGHDAILEFRKSLWSGPVRTRLHTLHKIFPFGENSHEVMLYGDVKYGLKNGREVTVDWAGRALMVKEGGEFKMRFYQVYLDGKAVADAAAEK